MVNDDTEPADAQLHARVTYCHERETSREADLTVYSFGRVFRTFELHTSHGSEATRGGKEQILSDWRRENQKLKAEGFLLKRSDVTDHDLDL